MTNNRRRHLRAVGPDERRAPRAFLVWVDTEESSEMDEIEALIVNQDWDPVYPITGLIDEVPFREVLRMLVTCDRVVLPDTWWASAGATRVVTVAGWMGMPLYGSSMKAIPTASMRGAGQ